ncbi:MAG: hypothetical protein Q9195_002737 [Heterodermia aff. obscurata]
MYSDDSFEFATFQPVLCLRGGGADAKRKEARKRKFATGPDKKAANLTEGAESSRKKARKQTPASPGAEVVPSSKNNATEVGPVKDAEAESTSIVQQRSQRFIVFVGNLPYSATEASITNHFAKVQPISTRHSTDKLTGKSKGFAFLEFAAYDRMKTCLKLYHHSSFDDGESPARKINVELTVGGGGTKSKDRKTKLKAKNWKLSEERRRRDEEDVKTRKKNMARKGVGGSRGKLQVDERAEKDGDGARAVDSGDIHPSRRSRVIGR